MCITNNIEFLKRMITYKILHYTYLRNNLSSIKGFSACLSKGSITVGDQMISIKVKLYDERT